MNEQLLIPEKIKVGYNKRGDTYTAKLGYVIYYDTKGKLRKETSWEGWRDKALPVDDFDNVPTEGFVLNRNVGGHRSYSYSDYGREPKIRVYDPRDFEIEITLANILFILEYSNSMRGKGLEGTFVYAWQGSELVLLPTECHEYQSSTDFTDLQSLKVTAKEIVPGWTYLTKDQQTLVYLGKFDKWQLIYNYVKNADHKACRMSDKKVHVFMNLTAHQPTILDKEELEEMTQEEIDAHYKEEAEDAAKDRFEFPKGFTKLAKIVSDQPVDNLADLIDRYYNSQYGTEIVGLISKPSPKVDADFAHVHQYGWSWKTDFILKDGNKENTFIKYKIEKPELRSSYTTDDNEKVKMFWNIEGEKRIVFETNKIREQDVSPDFWRNSNKKVPAIPNSSFEEVKALPWQDIYVKFKSGAEILYKNVDFEAVWK